MKRSRPLKSDPEKSRAWRRRSAQRYEDRLREEHGCPFRRIGANPERQKKEAARAYGPPERREFVTRQLPCVGCGKRPTKRQPNHQHHTKSGGVGRKADADSIVPLCPKCHRLEHDGNLLHEVDWEEAARRTEASWQRYQREGECFND